MKDEVLEVRLTLIKNIGLLNMLLGYDGIKRDLLPLFTQIQQEKQWRFRLAFCEYIPQFYKQLGKDSFDECFVTFQESFYQDHFAAIRSQCFLNFLSMAEETGFASIKSYLEKAILVMKSSSNYIFRVSAVEGIQKLYKIAP